ncbi:Heme A synthase/Protoheme IX farnesyltransferase [Metarhizium album ARSEF 1941]|uniref:Heme A synthase/Protoheme IX farnesyltransferase n=1 Tax=Metarhizium album (strain ARSEF 1941) TaxID=1081103 RepID=A0A0B2WZW2_METAS|nr:Heme A synthase/Protoheme IX farnesyltransferase [Metarhizium album ARSEF 1941]KHO01797.1 Heme A synthase/Protoheme IX farnesyltransferase [Metarhizium album ARSEF 1941]
MNPIIPGTRRLALQVPSRFFACNQCLRQTTPAPQPRFVSRILNGVRFRSFADAKPATSLGTLADRVALRSRSPHARELAKAAVFPKTNPKSVAYWLIGSAVSVFGIVVWGGLTRLTESGHGPSNDEFKRRLSITEWRPVTGSLPPMSRADWDSEFDKYRASPEFKLLNPHMTLGEFKKIYLMEWAHRVWGRLIGLSFVLPTVYLVARRRVTTKMAFNLVGISALIGFQGVIGWWMVKSGLRDDLFAPGSHPRVSQYRLTAHLATAFVCYSWMLLSGLSILRTRRLLADPKAAASALRALQNPALNTFRRSVFALATLTFITIMSGALVAGLDAGLIYNEFPMMGVGLTPPKAELWDEFYCRKADGSDLWWRNMLENPSTVQLDHRILAVSTFCAILALFAYSRTGRVAAALPKDAKKGAKSLVHLVSLQAALGICTLIYMVPIPLAAAHQAGSLAVLTGALVLAHRLRAPRPTLRLIEQRLKKLKE